MRILVNDELLPLPLSCELNADVVQVPLVSCVVNNVSVDVSLNHMAAVKAAAFIGQVRYGMSMVW